MFIFFPLQFSEGLNKSTPKTKNAARLRSRRPFRPNSWAISTQVIWCPNDAEKGQQSGPLMKCEHPDAVEVQRGIHQTILFPLDSCKSGVLSTTRRQQNLSLNRPSYPLKLTTPPIDKQSKPLECFNFAI